MGGDAEGRGGSGTICVRSQPHPLRHRRDPLCHFVTSPPGGGRARVETSVNLSPGGGRARVETSVNLSPLWGRAETSVNSPPDGGRCRRQRGSGTIFVRFQPHPLGHRRDPPLSLRDISPRWGESESRDLCQLSPPLCGGESGMDPGEGLPIPPRPIDSGPPPPPARILLLNPNRGRADAYASAAGRS